jgi:hypothetical protein
VVEEFAGRRGRAVHERLDRDLPCHCGAVIALSEHSGVAGHVDQALAAVTVRHLD